MLMLIFIFLFMNTHDNNKSAHQICYILDLSIIQTKHEKKTKLETPCLKSAYIRQFNIQIKKYMRFKHKMGVEVARFIIDSISTPDKITTTPRLTTIKRWITENDIRVDSECSNKMFVVKMDRCWPEPEATSGRCLHERHLAQTFASFRLRQVRNCSPKRFWISTLNTLKHTYVHILYNTYTLWLYEVFKFHRNLLLQFWKFIIDYFTLKVKYSLSFIITYSYMYIYTYLYSSSHKWRLGTFEYSFRIDISCSVYLFGAKFEITTYTYYTCVCAVVRMRAGTCEKSHASAKTLFKLTP